LFETQPGDAREGIGGEGSQLGGKRVDSRAVGAYWDELSSLLLHLALSAAGSKKKKSQAPAVTDVDRAVLDLKVQKRRLRDYQRRVEAAAAAGSRARQLVALKQRERALVELRKKKYMDQALARIDQQALRLEETLLSVQEAVATAAVVERLKQGSAALKELQRQIRIEDVERLMDDAAAAADTLADVNALLLEGLSAGDEQAAESELEAIESELLGAALPSLPTAQLRMPLPAPPLQLPSVPSSSAAAAPSHRAAEAAAAALRANAGDGVLTATEPMLA
jgi:charged multivesicular body protein 6